MKTHDWKHSLKQKLNSPSPHHEKSLAKERFMLKIQQAHGSDNSHYIGHKKSGPWLWLSVPVMALGVIFFFQTVQLQPFMSQNINFAHHSQLVKTQAEIDEIITTSYLEGFDEGATVEEELGE